MQKIRLSKTGKAAKYVSELSKERIQSGDQILYCSVCEKSIAIE